MLSINIERIWANSRLILALASLLSTSLPLLGFTGQHSCCANSLSTFLPLLGSIGQHSYRASPFPISLPLLSFIGQHSYCANPFHSLSFLGLFAFSLHLLLPWVFAKSFRLPWLNYHIFTSYYFLGLLTFKPTQWVY